MREYRIKKNFAKAGNIGPYPVRNVVEAVVLSLFWFFLVWNVPVELSIRLMLLVMFVVPTLAVSLIGIQGNSLSEIVFRYIRFHMFTKRSYVEPLPEEFSEREKKILRIKKRQLERMKEPIKEVKTDETDKCSP